ncbi:hypothetical protein Raf01_42540 [Rugosimonospora africana]|uniref:Uncharacterized protein n=1 Tax=Rugosimonospora africana TaxID=556532 RepID=A0A8J3QU29_9ACTN|nr:hypothetical protein Raf01_42540 [Rugosimonospora africana]
MPWGYALTALIAILLGFLGGMRTIKGLAGGAPCGGALHRAECADRTVLLWRCTPKAAALT